MTHTPTPYKVEQGQGYHEGHWVITAAGMPPHSPLAHVQQTCGPEESYPDAVFITIACNAHDELMKALKGVLHHNQALKEQYQLPDSLIGQIERALTKAEKGV